MLISGTIGYIYLKNKNKNIHIFLDNHTNNSYCNNSNPLFLNDFLKKYVLENNNFCNKKKQCDLNIFLEELINEENMISIHKNTKHVKKFFDFYNNTLKSHYKQYTYPFDIRQFLQVIDIVQIINNINKFQHLNCNYLFYYINIILNLKLNFHNINQKYIDIDIIKQLNKIKKLLLSNIKNTNLIKHYNLLRKKALKLYTISFNLSIKQCPEDFLAQLSYLIDNIMEFYCIFLIINNIQTQIIIYAGAFHCINIANKLVNNYNYQIINNSTKLDIKNLHFNYKDDSYLEQLNNYKNCIKLK